MRFTKNTGAFLLIVAIVLAVFCAVAFVIPFARLAGFWVGYSFGAFAILLAGAVGVFAFNRPGMRSKVYGLPLGYLVWVYMLFQLALSLAQMALPFIPVKYDILLNGIILAAFLIGAIGINAGKEEIERLDAKIQGKRAYLKSLQGELESLAARAGDAEQKKALAALAEAFRYSDPISPPQLAELENALAEKVGTLAQSLGGDPKASLALCEDIKLSLAERNRKCKALK